MRHKIHMWFARRYMRRAIGSRAYNVLYHVCQIVDHVMWFGINTHHYYRAPWSRWFTTYYLRGVFAHEVQIGPLVMQVRRRNKQWAFGLVHVWKDAYWR